MRKTACLFSMCILVLCVCTNSAIGWDQGSSTKEVTISAVSSSMVVRQMFFLDTATGWVVGNQGIIVKTTSGGTNWIQENPSTQNNIYYVFFVNKNLGWISGQSGMIEKTTDGGNTWLPQESGTSLDVLSMYMVNAEQGWAAVGDSGIILSTQNGGTTWQRQTSGVNVQLRNTIFTDMNHGWICGDSGVVVHTTDGGTHWASQNTHTSTYLWWIDFTDSLHGYVAGGRYSDNSTIFLKTTDGGGTWVSQTPASAYSSLFGTDFINADTGWVVGRSGTILKTTDGGNNWISQNYEGLWLAQVSFMTSTIGYAITGSPFVLCTTDGGNSWIVRNIIITPPPKALTITDVPNDNGKQVFLKWTTSGSPINLGITSFSIYRYDEQNWTYIKDIPVLSDTVYQAIAPTLYDSTIVQGMAYSTFMVLARTSTSSIYDTIGIDSGYSVDNLPPLAPTFGTVTQLLSGNVVIQWHAAANNYGDFKDYVLYRSTQQSFVPSPETRLAFVQDTAYTDIHASGNNYYYKITSRDYSGNESQPLSISAVTGIELANSQIPQSYNLSQNYPNPFNPSTQIQFSIIQSGYVTLRVFNLTGQEIATLVSQDIAPGTYIVKFNASSLSSGMYFYRLQTGTYSATKKMLVIK